MRSVILTIGDMDAGSTKYRVAQYLPFLEARGFSAEIIQRSAISGAMLGKLSDVGLLWNQKCLFDSSLARKAIRSSRRVLFDFDDAIYTRHGKSYDLVTRFRVERRLRTWLEKADTVTVANGVLADYARQFTSNVQVIPMALDLESWSPRPHDSDRFNIGWAGSPVNLKYLESIQGALGVVLGNNRAARLMVFSGRTPALQCPFEYYPYRPGQEIDFIRRLDIGLLPLPPEEYTRGKSPIKAIQYLACGVPVVGNIMGATKEILLPENSIGAEDEQDWVGALEALIKNRDRARAMGSAGRRHVEEFHDVKKWLPKMFSLVETENGG